MAERASMPTFVPRTVATFERAATAVARRVAAPVRMLATRALSFADRLMGSWAGTGPTVGGLDSGVRPTMRSAARSGGLPMPRPWYEVDAVEDLIWPQAEATASATDAPGGAAAMATAASAASAAADRGAAIARTNVTAPPDAPVRQGAAPAITATTTAASVPPAASATDAALTGAPSSGASNASTNSMAGAGGDVRAAEALGLRVPLVAPAPMVTAPVARATTPLGRALAHAAWVDTQLRSIAVAAATTTETAVRATAGYVFVAPADTAAATARGQVNARQREETRAEFAGEPAAARTEPLTMTTPAASVAAWSARLPDPRLPETLPTAIARGVAAFVAQLAGVETARDVAVLSPMAARAAAAAADAPASIGRAAPTATYVALPVVSWRPGAAAARSEQLGAHVDARVTAAWGEPAAAPIVDPMRAVATATGTAAPATAVPAATGRAETGRARALPSVVPTYVAATNVGSADVAPAQTRATGPARMADFVQQLVGVQAARATAPLPVQALVAAAAGETRAAAARATSAVAASAASARVPERVALMATSEPAAARAGGTAAEVLSVGGIGRRAEQLGGVVGVRAASLSIDFVDPSRFALLTAAAPSMPTVQAAPATTQETIMPAPRPFFATPVPAATSLSAEEWSLVATFPSAATAVQLAAARQSQQWREETAIAAGQAATVGRLAAHRGAPAEYVVPVAEAVAPAEQSRLPGGRMPRGSFTWPKLAEASPARAEWSASAAVSVAEQAAQVAPGMPLWGALPRLETVAPSLAASAGLMTPAAIARTTPAATRAAATSTFVAGEGVRASSSERGEAAASLRIDAPADAEVASRIGSDAPAMTLMTAAATREARAAARAGGREPGVEGGGDAVPMAMPSVRAGEPARGGVSNVRAPMAMPLSGVATRDGAAATGATVGPAARALELARPFLRLVENGLTGAEGGSRAGATPRFFDQPQPIVAGAPSSDSASRIVEALRTQPAAATSDDRVSLADLTLIAIASATQQVAASPAGGGPSGGGAAAAPAASSEPASGGSKKSGNPAQEVEELARAAFDELQRLFAMARERSGDHG